MSGNCQDRTSGQQLVVVVERCVYFCMMSILTSRRGRRGLMIVCLAAGLAVVAALGYAAISAAREQRQTVESVLRDYADLAAEQYAGSTAMALDYNWFFPALRQLRAEGDQLEAPHADTVINTQGGKQRLGDLATRFFAVRPADGSVGVPQGWPPLDNTISELPVQAQVAVAESWPIAAFVDENATPARLIAFAVTGSDPERRVIAGFAADLATFDLILGPALRADRVLPRSLIDDAPSDDLISVRISTPAGRTIYQSGPEFDPTFSAAAELGRRLGGLRVETAIPASSASRLVIGGLPYSRIPAVGAMLLVTIALTGAGMLLLRRERDLVRLRERFVAGASHELRTPLAQIRLFAETLRLDRVRSDDERQRSLEIMDREARRLTYLVENLLQFSRARAGQIRSAPDHVELCSFGAEILESFRPLAAARDATVQMAAPAGEVGALADRDMLAQVLLNLLDNATKYGPSGQTITVSVRGLDDGTVALQVDDEGPGVPPAQRGQIWERFWRGPETDHTTGTGIGLALVKELVELQNGTVAVETAPGGGARFCVLLPQGAAT